MRARACVCVCVRVRVCLIDYMRVRGHVPWVHITKSVDLHAEKSKGNCKQ